MSNIRSKKEVHKTNEPLAKGLWELLKDEHGKYQYIGHIDESVNDKINNLAKYHMDKMNDLSGDFHYSYED